MAGVSREIKEHPLYERALKMSRDNDNKYMGGIEYSINFIEEWEKITKELRVHDRTGD